jgi:hypothetical protein
MSENQGEGNRTGQEPASDGGWVRDRGRRPRISGIVWALVLIWVGLVLLAVNLGLSASITWANMWSYLFTGAGVIVLAGGIYRLVVPAHRRWAFGPIIFGLVLIGFGVGWLYGWSIIWPLVIVSVGVAILLGAIFRRQ